MATSGVIRGRHRFFSSNNNNNRLRHLLPVQFPWIPLFTGAQGNSIDTTYIQQRTRGTGGGLAIWMAV